MEFIVQQNEMMQWGALTSLALYDLYIINAAHEE